MKHYALSLALLICACSSDEGDSSSTKNADGGSSATDSTNCTSQLGGTWKITAANERNLVEPPNAGGYCRGISAGGTVTAVVSEDLKTLTVQGSAGSGRVHDIAPMDSTCSGIVATWSAVVDDEYSVRHRYTLQRQPDGSMSGEFEAIMYATATGPEPFDCQVTIATSAVR